MKKLIILLVMLMAILFACGGTQDNKDNYNDIIIIDTTTDTSDDIPPVIPPVSPNPVKLIFYNNDTKDVYFHDGTTDTLWKTGAAASAGNRKIAVDNILYTLDEYGEILLTTDLLATPKVIRIINSDIWIAEVIPPEVAITYGWLPKTYTRIYQNDILLGRYEYEAKCFVVTQSGDIFMRDTVDTIHDVTITYADFYTAIEGGFVMYDYDVGGSKTAQVKYEGLHSISWSLNYLNSSKNKWLKSGDTWYSWNGYKWDATSGLQELVTSLQDFWNEPYPVSLPDGIPWMIEICTYNEDNIDKLYWLELRTGLLFKYDSSADSYNSHAALYMGTNKTIPEAMERQLNLKPIVFEDYLYYYDGSENLKSLRRCHLRDGGFCNIVKLGNYEAWRFE
jgi:hypothetical protein